LHIPEMAKVDTSVLNTALFIIIFAVLLFLSGTWLVFLVLFGVALLATSLLRTYVLNKRLEPPANAAVLITGCSSGIGEHAAVHLASRGLLVFAGVRSVEQGERLKQLGNAARLVPVVLDVTDEKQIAEAVTFVQQTLKDKNATLLGVVNNAGYAEAGPMEVIPVAKLRKQLEVNVVGQVAVTQAFLPLLRAPAEGATGAGAATQSKRIIFISSGVGKVVLAGTGSYAASKHALEAIADALRMELAPWKNIDVVLVEPGAIETEFRATANKMRGENMPAQVEHVDSKVLAQYQRYAEEVAVREGAKNKSKRAHVSICTEAIEAALFDSIPLTRYLCGNDVMMLPLALRLPDRWLDLYMRGPFK